MKNISYWLDTALPYTPHPPLQENIETDIVVIGAGITGVSAAYHSVMAGYKTVLIDKDLVASGSAGKNGGMVVEGLAIDFNTAIKEFGKEQAVEAWQRTIDAREHVVSVIKDNAIPCDFSRCGSLYAASDTKDIEYLNAELQARQQAGFTGEILSQFNPKKECLSVKDDCSLHPVKFIRGLTTIAEKAGLLVFEETPALSFDTHTVTTPQGIIHAKKVIVAIESGKKDLTSKEGVIHREIALVTEPLSPEDLSTLSWNIGGMFWNTGNPYIAVRKIGNRLILNGSINIYPSEGDVLSAGEKVIERFLSFAPTLSREKIIISHRWTGLLLYPERHRPFITNQNGYYELFGNGGNGLTNGIMLGKFIIESFAGNQIPEIYKEL